jgi:beta-lactamase regulating signal transducer with metallopeptidase domain
MSVLNGMHAREVVALGWTLLHFCWQSTAIAVVYAVIDRCTTRASAPIRYGIALGVLLLLPLVAVATFVEQEQLVLHMQMDEREVVASQLGAMHAVMFEQMPAAAPVIGNSELWVAQHAGLLLPWMDVVWLAGVLLLALRATGGWWELRTLRQKAQSMVPQDLRISFDELVRRYQLSRRVMLRVSDEVISPMVFGVWRTVVLVPLSVTTSLSTEQLEAILAHELAHVRRWDYLCNLLQTSVECLFFFQPAVWWMSRRAREFREVCCDEVAARACSDPVVYAEALLHMEEHRAQQRQLAVALHGSAGTLLNRVRRVMGEKAMERESMSGVRVAVVGMVLMGLYVGPHVAHGMNAERRQAVVAAAPAAAPNAEKAMSAPASVSVSASVIADRAPEPQPAPSVGEMPAPSPAPQPTPSAMAMEESSQQGGGMEYLRKMRDAGYPLDLNKDLDQIIALRSVGVTPEYAMSMAQVGLGTPSLHDLVTLKSVGVTPEYIASLKGSVIAPESLHDVVTTRSLGITPEYARSLESLGLGKPSVHDVVSMKSMGITPEYVASLKNSMLAPTSFHDVVTVKSLGITPEYARSLESLGLGKPTMHDVVSMKSVGVTPEYLAVLKAGGIVPADLHEAVSLKAVGVTPEYAGAMASAGFPGMNAHELIAMRAQGMTPQYAKWLKATFPDADSHAMREATVFHIDADFIAKAKASGFNGASLDKLTKLKMSGLLN